jgi:hypothetical protein
MLPPEPQESAEGREVSRNVYLSVIEDRIKNYDEKTMGDFELLENYFYIVQAQTHGQVRDLYMKYARQVSERLARDPSILLRVSKNFYPSDPNIRRIWRFIDIIHFRMIEWIQSENRKLGYLPPIDPGALPVETPENLQASKEFYKKIIQGRIDGPVDPQSLPDFELVETYYYMQSTGQTSTRRFGKFFDALGDRVTKKPFLAEDILNALNPKNRPHLANPLQEKAWRYDDTYHADMGIWALGEVERKTKTGGRKSTRKHKLRRRRRRGSTRK